ncbi:MAG: hypothetical protein C0605_02355 [Hyphomicrobiales bacterium]|nr:MAG: hypothetical protein C0605_02355 [Hyphomicrobiales bacterium]
MSLAARRRPNSGANYWPGFVDALSTLLLVIIFLLSMFMLAQFFLSQAISGKDTALKKLNAQMAELTELLALEQESTKSLKSELATLTSSLSTLQGEKDNLVIALGKQKDKAEAARSAIIAIESRLKQANADREKALADLEDSRRDIIILQRRAAQSKRSLTVLTDELKAEKDLKSAALKQMGLQKQQIVVLRDEMEAIKAESGKREEVIAGLKKTASEAASEAKMRQEIILGLKDTLAKARGVASEKQQIIIALRDDMEKAIARADKQKNLISSLTNQSEDITRQAGAQKKQIEDLRGKITAARSEAEKRRLLIVDLRSKAEKALAAGKQQQQTVIDLRSKEEKARALAEQQKQLVIDLRSKDKKNQAIIADLRSEEEKAKALNRKNQQIILDLRTEEEKAKAREQALSRKLSQEETLKARALAQVELLNQQIAAIRKQMAALQELLDASEERDRKANVKIADLGRRLNVALAQKVSELKKYRSEFFGRLREILGKRTDIRIVGDRFVFQSEVLFDPGAAEINQAGSAEMAKLATALITLNNEIPAEINWVLRVDGHTDATPINTPAFPSNWELSVSRALSVVHYLTKKGVPPDRLVAAGFGEFHPIDTGDSPEALARNRRIELKLTER